MATKSEQKRREVPAIRLTQWLTTWDAVRFNPSARQAKPKPDFFIFAMRAAELKALTGSIDARRGTTRAVLTIKRTTRAHDEDRRTGFATLSVWLPMVS
jgi:hypothetical protein